MSAGGGLQGDEEPQGLRIDVSPAAVGDHSKTRSVALSLNNKGINVWCQRTASAGGGERTQGERMVAAFRSPEPAARLRPSFGRAPQSLEEPTQERVDMFNCRRTSSIWDLVTVGVVLALVATGMPLGSSGRSGDRHMEAQSQKIDVQPRSGAAECDAYLRDDGQRREVHRERNRWRGKPILVQYTANYDGSLADALRRLETRGRLKINQLVCKVETEGEYPALGHLPAQWEQRVGVDPHRLYRVV
jgi:hypothetical protein